MNEKELLTIFFEGDSILATQVRNKDFENAKRPSIFIKELGFKPKISAVFPARLMADISYIFTWIWLLAIGLMAINCSNYAIFC
jgi:hypothetical protein